MKIENIIKELFTSKEMSEYLIKNINDIPKCKILEMILKAPIDLRRKGEMLLELSKDETNEHQYPLPQGKMTDKEYYDLEFSLFNNSFKYNYDFLSKALSELETKNGDVFSVQNLWCDEEWPKGYGEGSFHIFSSFEKYSSFFIIPLFIYVIVVQICSSVILFISSRTLVKPLLLSLGGYAILKYLINLCSSLGSFSLTNLPN